jgi:hypothetical protein
MITLVKIAQGVTKGVAATKINPDDVIFYALNYMNFGDEAADYAVLEGPIPQGKVYFPGGAYGVGAKVTFSVDGG